jgi:hypothetical protein
MLPELKVYVGDYCGQEKTLQTQIFSTSHYYQNLLPYSSKASRFYIIPRPIPTVFEFTAAIVYRDSSSRGYISSVPAFEPG